MFNPLKLLAQPDITVRHARLPEVRDATGFRFFLDLLRPDKRAAEDGVASAAQEAEADLVVAGPPELPQAARKVTAQVPLGEDEVEHRAVRLDAPAPRDPVPEPEPPPPASGQVAAESSARDPVPRAHEDDAAHPVAMQREEASDGARAAAAGPELAGLSVLKDREIRRPVQQALSPPASAEMRATTRLALEPLAHEPLAQHLAETAPDSAVAPRIEASRGPPGADRLAEPILDGQIAARSSGIAPRAPSAAERPPTPDRDAQMAVRASGIEEREGRLRGPQVADQRSISIPPPLVRPMPAEALLEDGARRVSLAELALRGRVGSERPAHPGKFSSSAAPVGQHVPLPGLTVEPVIQAAPTQAEDLAPAATPEERDMLPLTLPAQSDPATPAPVLARPQTVAPAPSGLAAQLAEAMRRHDQQVIRIQLAPEELGRVRITLQHGEAGMHLLIQCERPETQDLMRRHAIELARDLAEMGFEGLSLDFSGRQHRGDPLPPESRFTPDPALPPGPLPETLPATHAPARSASGLDVRV